MQYAATFAAAVCLTARAGTWDDQMFAAERYRTAGQYAEAVKVYRIAQSEAGSARELAITDNNMASVCAELGRRDEARRLYRAALETWEQTLPADAEEIQTTLNNLGALYAAERRYKDAAYYYQRALKIRETPSTLNNLAELY